MPITPLHFGVLAPVNHWFPGKVSTISFVMVTAWIDIPFIEAVLTGQPLPSHDDMHSLAGVLIIGTLIAMPGVRYAKWVIGAYLAALNHLLLDGLIHADMQPFGWIAGNPLRIINMQTLSLILLPFMLWFIVQTVSSVHGWLRGRIGLDRTEGQIENICNQKNN